MAGRKKVRKAAVDSGDHDNGNSKKLKKDAEELENEEGNGKVVETEDAKPSTEKTVEVEKVAETTVEPESKTEDKTDSEVDDGAKNGGDLKEGDYGRVVIFGSTNWDLTGRKELPKSAGKNVQTSGKNLWGPHTWSEKTRIKKAVSSCTACHSIIITEDGRAMTFGRNDKGQLGLGDLVTRATPVIVDALKDYTIIDAACGKGHTLFLTDKGTVWACGDNKMGQLGIGSQSQNVMSPSKVSYTGKPIVKLACGGEFSMIVDAFGGLHSFGSPEHGQLGHNSEGKYFTTGNKISFHCETTPRRVVVFIEKTREGHVIPVEDVSVVDIACGVNHAVCIDKKKRVFTWGFAGYGRLGHSETKNELMPRNVKSFDYVKRGAQKVWAGSTFSLALDENGLLYFWGQTKSSGEATMYPKTIPDLCGWNIRDIACANKSIVVVADNSVISWGPSPTYGELGYGESKAKSSTTPQEVKILDGIYIRSVACGFGHTLAIARDDSQSERDLIDKLPKWP